MANFYVGEVLFETGGTIDTPGDITVTSILDCAGTIGTAGQILSSTGTALLWTTAGAAGIPCSILTAKGDIVVATGASTPVALPVGTDGQLLYACSAATSGLCWAAAPSISAATPTTSGTLYGCTDAAAPDNTALGIGALEYAFIGCCNTAIGTCAQRTGDGCGNTSVGAYSLWCSQNGPNIAIGCGAGCDLSSGCLNVVIGTNVQTSTPSSQCELAIGYTTGELWLSGNSTKAIKPGAGIIDCANSCGTAGQILYSQGNAICWGAAPSGASPATPTVAGVLEGYSCGTDGNISVGFGSMAVVDPANGGCKNTSLGVCALSNLTFGAANVAIGTEALFSATNVGNSIAIGNCALRASTFSGNVAIGNRAACTVTAGGNNVAIGSVAMQNATTPSLSIAIGCRAMQFGAGDGNIGFGLQALCKVSGSENIAIGTASGSNITTGVNNTFLGGVTGGFISTGSCNVFIGFGAGPTTNTDCCLWIGIDSTPPWLTGDNTSAIKPGAGIIDCAGSCGTAGQFLTSNGANAICWANSPVSAATPLVQGIVYGCTDSTFTNMSLGYCAGAAAFGVGTGNTFVGTCAGRQATSNNNVILGSCSGGSITTGGFHVAIGAETSTTQSTGLSTVAVGYRALRANTASSVVGVGICALQANTGNNNVAVGGCALSLNTGGAQNTAIGESALKSNVAGTNNVALGAFSFLGGSYAANNNTGVGAYTGTSITTGACNVYVGARAGCGNTTGSFNVAIGADAFYQGCGGSRNIAIGYTVMQFAAGAVDNISIGANSANAMTTAASNITIGSCAARSLTTGSCNISIGQNALCAAGTTSSSNITIGTLAGCDLTGAVTNNVVIGHVVNPLSATGSCQLAIGFATGCYWLTGDSTKAIKPGAGIIDCAGSCGTTGQVLSSVGNAICWITPGGASSATPSARGIVYGCTTDAHPVSGSGDVALGLNAYAAVTTGYSNAAIGGDALAGLTSGCNNIGIGDQAGFAITTESDNVIIGANSVLNCAPSKSVVVGSGVDFVFGNTENVIVGHSAASSGAIGTAVSCSVILGGCALTNTTQVGDNLIAIGHAIALPNSNGSTQLAIGNGSTYWLSGDSNYAVKPGAGIIDCAGSCGTTGQVLTSNGSNALQWATPQTSPYVTYTTSAVTYTSGTPVLVAVWGGGTIQGTVTLDLVGYGGVNQFWDFYLSGDPTNYNTGWYQYATWPDPSNALSQGTWYVNFPVYPDPNANLWELYFNPAQNSLNASSFTFFYRPLPGSAVPAWQI